jgi:hypothetical protein
MTRGIGRKRVVNKIKLRTKCDPRLRVFPKRAKEFPRKFKSQTRNPGFGSILAEMARYAQQSGARRPITN